MIGIIDYGLGNLASVANALENLGAEYVVSRDVAVLNKADKYIFPGVGAAGEGMKNLKKFGLDIFIVEQIKKRKPLLGICLGMQLLFEKSEEGNVNCLGVIKGTVKKLKTDLKIPQIGWNQIKIQNSKFKNILNNISDTSYVYFVNSYICITNDNSIVTATTDYEQIFCSGLQKENVYGLQLHPEKSGEVGQKILRNFCEL